VINRKNSVHLQDFPELSFLPDEKELVDDMDLVRSICSVALAIRDNKNLRVRLPLAKLTIFGKKAARILPFSEIIAEEVNVKSVEIQEEISELAELKLQINFKKIGAKFGAKIKEITSAAKNGEWKKTSEQKIEIAGLVLEGDDFEIKLATKNNDENKFALMPLPSNEFLVQLDIEVTKELEDEGIARDVIRAVQQNRKDANLNISDHITLKLFSNNSRVLQAIKVFENYIKEQVLANSLEYSSDVVEVKNSTKLFYENKLDDGDLFVGLSVFL
jgi:isoleucyl-tRNA synthetase